MDEMRLDGHVAIVTGAGRGLGKAYAEQLAARGARVVINDPGVDLDGSGGDTRPAQDVVDGIIAAGGEAVPNFEAVGTEEAAASLVDLAMSSFGQIDILINNAGTFTPMWSFLETSTESFENLYRVHVMGTIHNTRAVWPHWQSRGYGKLINIVSAVGYVGSAGRLEYGTAKGAVHGFTTTLAQDSLEHGVHVNAISPGARTRPVTASSDHFPEELEVAFSPDLVAPTAVWLAHPSTTVNGKVFTAIAGTTAQVVIGETYGYGSDTPTPEDIRDHADAIFMTREQLECGFHYPTDSTAEGMEMVSRFGNRR